MTEVLGTLAAIISLTTATRQVYKQATNTTDLPKAFDVIVGQIPLVQKILESAEKQYPRGGTPDDASIESTLKICKNHVASLEALFKKIFAGDNAGLRERCTKHLRNLFRDRKGKVEGIWKAALESLQLLDSYAAFTGVNASMRLDDLIAVIDEVEESLPSPSSGVVVNNEGEHSGAGNVFNTGTGSTASYHTYGGGYTGTGYSVHNYERGTTVYNNPPREDEVGRSLLHPLLSKRVQAARSNRFRDLLGWLDAPDPTTDHYEAQRRYELGTGEWFLESEDFGQWLEGKRQILWLHGPAGCCKTILCSAAIERAITRCKTGRKTGCKVIYFYFTFRDARKQSYHGLLLSIISQLVDSSWTPKSLQAARDRNQRHNKELELVLVDIISRYLTIHLLIDGLDESPPDDGSRAMVKEGLAYLTSTCPNLKLLVASRRESDIEDFVTMAASETKTFAVEAKSVDRDIKLHVEREIGRNAKLRRLPEEIKELIAKHLTEKGGGMFRWVDCQLDSLKRLKIMRPQYIKEVLKDLPRTLDETYDRILLQLGHSQEVLSILRCLAFTMEDSAEMTFEELREVCVTRTNLEPFVDVPSRAAAVQLIYDMSSLLRFDGQDLEWADGGSGSAMFSTSRGDLHDSSNAVGSAASSEVDSGKNGDSEEVGNSRLGLIRVTMAHRSVKEYLMSEYITNGPAAAFHLYSGFPYYRLAQTCIAYLLHFEAELRCVVSTKAGLGDQFDILNSETWSVIEKLTTTYPLTRYAVRNWAHFQYAAEQSGLEFRFLQSRSTPDLLRCLSLWTGSYDTLFGLMVARSASMDGFAIVAASAWGLEKVVLRLADSHRLTENGASDHGLAMIALCAEERINSPSIIQHFLRKGVCFNNSTEWGCAQYESLAQELRYICNIALANPKLRLRPMLVRFIDMYTLLDPAQSCYANAFHLALRSQDREVVEEFLKSGVDSNTTMGPEIPLTALQYACSRGDESSIRSLLRYGADPNLPTHGVRPLWIALNKLHGHKSGVVEAWHLHKLLLAGADPNSGRDDGGNAETALQLAERLGSTDVIKILLEAGARPEYTIVPTGPAKDWKPPRDSGNLENDEKDRMIKDFLAQFPDEDRRRYEFHDSGSLLRLAIKCEDPALWGMRETPTKRLSHSNKFPFRPFLARISSKLHMGSTSR